jgi:hypothetical protein
VVVSWWSIKIHGIGAVPRWSLDDRCSSNMIYCKNRGDVIAITCGNTARALRPSRSIMVVFCNFGRFLDDKKCIKSVKYC